MTGLIRLITVEPVEFIYCVMFSMSAVVRDNLFIDKGKSTTQPTKTNFTIYKLVLFQSVAWICVTTTRHATT